MLLKRLFIGLLILSALTGDSAAFYNTALVPLQNYIADLYSVAEEKDMHSAGILERGRYVSSLQYRISAFIPLEEILQNRDNSDGYACVPYTCLIYEPCPSFGLAELQAAGTRNMDISLNGSDISPPSISFL